MASEEGELSVFPNPVSDVMRVRVQTAGQGTLTLLDMSGRVVASSPIQSETTTLDLTDLPAGSYIMHYNNGESLLTRNIQVIR